jgi:hypothetical protein
LQCYLPIKTIQGLIHASNITELLIEMTSSLFDLQSGDWSMRAMLKGVLLDSTELRQFVSRCRKLATIKLVAGRRQHGDAVVKDTALESLISFLDKKLEGAGPILREEELRDEHFEGGDELPYCCLDCEERQVELGGD